MSRYVTEAQLAKIVEEASQKVLMQYLSEADAPKPKADKTKPEPIACVVIEGHPTRKTWTKKMKSENDKAYKAGLKAGDDYPTRLTAGLEAAKKVA